MNILKPKITNYYNFTIPFYILLMPFVSAFSISAWAPLPLIFLLTLFMLQVVTLKVSFSYQRDDLLLVLFALLSVALISFSFSFFDSKTINHIAALLTVIFIYYFFVKNLINKVTKFDLIFKYCAISILFVSIYIIIEFLAIMSGFQIDDFIFRPTVEIMDATVFGGSYLRPRGFAEEAGHMAMFYEVYLPLSFIYIRDKGVIVILLFYSVVLPGYFLLFSSASIASFVFVILIWFLIEFIKFIKKPILRMPRKVVLLGFILLFGSLIYHERIISYFGEAVIVKLLGILNISDSFDPSSADRLEKYGQFFNLISEYPLGIGWGIAASSMGNYKGINIPSGFISLYAEIFAASGIVGGFIFLSFLVVKLIKTMKIWSFNGKIYFISFLWVLVHYLFASNYWLPWIWFLMALIDISYHRNKFLNRRSP